MAIRSAAGPAAIVLILAAVTACGGTASGSPTTAASPQSAATPTAGVTSSPTPASVAGPLEDLLPDEVGGIKLTKESVAGPDLGELDPEEAANFAAILENVDGPPEAFVAVAALGDGVNLIAMRMEGTEGGQLGDSFIGVVMQSHGGEGQVADVTIGGKPIKRITAPGIYVANPLARRGGADPVHVYVTGEIMFVVQAATPALVEEAFATLP